MGTGSRVDTAGAPVSPLMSAPSPDDFLLGRAIPLKARDLRLDVPCLNGCTTKSGNFSRVCDCDMGVGGKIFPQALVMDEE